VRAPASFDDDAATNMKIPEATPKIASEIFFCASAAFGWPPSEIPAQSFPNRTITLGDFRSRPRQPPRSSGRGIADRMSQRAGESSVRRQPSRRRRHVGTKLVARANPTATSSARYPHLGSGPLSTRSAAYDPRRICLRRMIALLRNCWWCIPRSPLKTLADLIAIHGPPVKVNSAPPGSHGNHSAGEYFARASGLPRAYPYKDGAALTDVLGRGTSRWRSPRSQLRTPTSPAGLLRALAVTSKRQQPVVRTCDDFPNRAARIRRLALLLPVAPAGTPRAVIDKLTAIGGQRSPPTSVQKHLAHDCTRSVRP